MEQDTKPITQVFKEQTELIQSIREDIEKLIKINEEIINQYVQPRKEN